MLWNFGNWGQNQSGSRTSSRRNYLAPLRRLPTAQSPLTGLGLGWGQYGSVNATSLQMSSFRAYRGTDYWRSFRAYECSIKLAP
jgi:hypothetical protein